MNYTEYQVWFHVYNTAIGSLFRNDDITMKSKESVFTNSAELCIKAAELAANKALEKYGEVEKSQAQGESPIDLQGFVDTVAKSVAQGKPNKKR